MKPCYNRGNYWQCPDCKAGIKPLPDGRGILCPTCLGDAARPKAPRHPKVVGPLPDDWKDKLAATIEENALERQKNRR